MAKRVETPRRDGPPGPPNGGQPPGTGGEHEIDWAAIEESQEFKDLENRKRAFVLPATIFFLSFYMAFILLAGYAPDFMGSSIYEGFTVGYLLALTQFVMVLVLGIWYLRKADKDFDPLAERAIQGYAERADLDVAPTKGADGSGPVPREVTP